MKSTLEPITNVAVREAIGLTRAHWVAVVRRKSRGAVDADEVVQTAFARALERAGQLRDPSRAEAWLGRIVHTALLDELRKRRLPYSTYEDTGDSLVSFTETCDRAAVQVEQLKPEYAALLRRIVADGAPVAQVAAELGLSANNAMVRLHRARKALKAQLLSHCGTTSARACLDCVCGDRGCCRTHSGPIYVDGPQPQS